MPDLENASRTRDSSDTQVLEKLVGLSGLLILELDADGRIEWFNPGFAALAGVALSEVQGQDWIERFVPSPHRKEARGLCKGLLGKSRGDAHTKPFLVAGGGERLIEWFHSDLLDDSGTPRGILCIGRDVTEIQDARQALIEAEQRSRGVLETAVNAIVTMGEDRRIQTVNQAALKMFGYREDELLGENVNLLMPEPYRSQHDGYIENYCKTGKRKIIGIGREAVARRKDGSVFPIDLSVGEVILTSGKRIFTGIIRDLSEKKELEERILRISEEEQQRIGQDIHDDLCQQLAAIGCLAQVIQQRLKKQENAAAADVDEVVRLIATANQRAREMSRGLMPVVLDSAGLQTALEELVQSTERIFPIRCRVDLDPQVRIRDNATAIQLYRIAQEATANAAKHSRATKLTLGLRQDETAVELTVEDNGVGIPDHSPGSGTGMGLLTMNRRARMLGGELDISTRSLGGTLVQCRIPKQP